MTCIVTEREQEQGEQAEREREREEKSVANGVRVAIDKHSGWYGSHIYIHRGGVGGA